MATIAQFENLVGKTVCIRALRSASNRTRARIRERGGSDGSFVVENVSSNVPALSGLSGILFRQTSFNAGNREPWRGWLLVEEIEIVS